MGDTGRHRDFNTIDFRNLIKGAIQGPLGDIDRHRNRQAWTQILYREPLYKKFNKGAMQGPLGDTGRHKDLSQVSGPKRKKFNKGAMQGPLGDTGRHKDLSQVSCPK